MNTEPKQPTLSLILPCLNEASHIAESAEVIIAVLEEMSIDFELILIDDGSTDETWAEFEKIAAKHHGIQALSLSRRFGKEQALCAGLEAARGEAAILMDADLQHPPSLIPEMVRVWQEEDIDVVEAKKTDRGDESFLARTQARLFYSMLRRMSGFDLTGASDFKLLDRKVIDAWAQMPERNLFFRGMSAWLGFRRKEVFFEVEERAGGASGWNLSALLRLAITGITAFSSVPIHLVTLLGLIFLGFAILLGGQTLYNWLTGGAGDGFTTVILLLLITGSAIMIGLGIIGTYVSRIYNEVKGRPRYLVRQRLDY
jgi:glycosyltransferase involved in cell wall biosynthesis